MQFIEQVAMELRMTEEDKCMFTQPRATYTKYCRNVIYDTNQKQITLFENIATFPENAINVRDKQKALIMFLDYNPKYQDRNYIFVWFKMAHECYLNQCMIEIPDYEFSRSSKSVKHSEMSFTKKLKKNSRNDSDGQINALPEGIIRPITNHQPIVTEPDELYPMQPHEYTVKSYINQSYSRPSSANENNEIDQLIIQFNRLAIE